MADIIQLRRDTESNWASANPILAQGEIGLEIDNNRFKMGDGTTNWNSLPYFASGGGISTLKSQIITSSTRIDNLSIDDDTDIIVIEGTGNELTGVDANGISRRLVVINNTGDFYFFTFDSGNSSTNNRLRFTVAVNANGSIEMLYSLDINRWVRIG